MFERFEEIFDEVMNEMHIDGWWELFDSESFDEVEYRICRAYGVANATEVEGFTEWCNEMAMDL